MAKRKLQTVKQRVATSGHTGEYAPRKRRRKSSDRISDTGNTGADTGH